MQSTFPIGPRDLVFQKTAVSFDASVWEFFAPLIAGARLVMAKPGGHRDSAYLVEAIQHDAISILQVVPTVLRLLVEEPGLPKCVSLRRLFCGGEALAPELVESVYSALDVELINLYGPAEACINALYYPVPRSGSKDNIPIGRSAANTRFYILDSQFLPLPAGKVGELFLAGDSLGRGYQNQPALTAERFLPNSQDGTGGRMYLTGDLARQLPDGNVEYFGRIDSQVKILGGRLELGEIERLIGQLPGVRQSVVVVREDTAAVGAPVDRRLVAYLVLRAGVIFSAEQLRQQLRNHLPDYMLPANFVFLETLPVLPSGKLDRRALANLELYRPVVEKEYIPPRKSLEKMLARIWSETLETDQVGLIDNFFDLGGDSLLAFRLMNRVQELFGADLSLLILFMAPTFSDFSDAILDHVADKTGIEQIARLLLDLEDNQDGDNKTISHDR
jgi:acyl-coenzyme A synthetase/AMP-(fatty) acid ligase/acyl carrier protein